MNGRHGARKPSGLGRKTFREAVSEVDRETRGDPNPRELPRGYGDEFRWRMAEEFARQAYKNRVYIGSVGIPYIYKAIAEVITTSGIRKSDPKRWVYRGKKIDLDKVGVLLVQYFWDHAPWDHVVGENDSVLAMFTDPLMFEDCAEDMFTSWESQRLRHEFEERRAAGIEYEPMVRVAKPATGYKHTRGDS